MKFKVVPKFMRKFLTTFVNKSPYLKNCRDNINMFMNDFLTTT